MVPVIITPHRASAMIGYTRSLERGSRMTIIRIMPYPPSLRRMAASTMDPATGASTWAFGSQRWTPYRGIFTRNAIRHPAHQTLSLQEPRVKGCAYWIVIIESVPMLCCSKRRATNKGREPASV